MNDEKKREIQKSLEEQDRLNRLEEAGWERPTGRASPERYWNESHEERPVPRRERLTEEEMRKTGDNRTDYPAGTGSYYSETFVHPYGRASPESSFNEPFRNREPPAHARELTEEEMRKTGDNRTDYPAGTGSYYSETFVRPVGRASPERYWNEPLREPPARRVKSAGPETHRKRTERHHPVKKTRVVKHVEAPPRPVAARQEKVHRELVHEPPRETIYEEPVERPIQRISPFEVRSREPEYRTYAEDTEDTEVVPERWVERIEIGPDGKERLLSERRLEDPERNIASESTSERYYEPERRAARTEEGVFQDEREWADPRTAGHLRGRAQAAWGGASEKGQRYGTEAVTRGRDLGHRIGDWGREAGHRAGEWGKEAETRARESATSRDPEDTAYRAGSALGMAIRKVTSVSRELSSGFREGMGDENPEGRWEEDRGQPRERYPEEEARYHEGSMERRRPAPSQEGYYSESEIEERPGKASVEIKGRTREAYGEVSDRPPSKKTRSAPSKAKSQVKSQAKRTASTAKRKIKKVEEDL